MYFEHEPSEYRERKRPLSERRHQIRGPRKTCFYGVMHAGVAQLFRVRNAGGISQGNLLMKTCFQSRSSGVAGRDLSLPGQGSNFVSQQNLDIIRVVNMRV
jgi:hypothetical protein